MPVMESDLSILLVILNIVWSWGSTATVAIKLQQKGPGCESRWVQDIYLSFEMSRLVLESTQP